MIDRLKGFQRRARSARPELDPALVPHTAVTMEGGQDAARQLLSGAGRERGPHAIFALSDVMAIGVLHGAHELGLSIPGDVSVVGYDDIELAALHLPAADHGAPAGRRDRRGRRQRRHRPPRRRCAAAATRWRCSRS